MRMSNGTAVLLFSVLIFLWADVILKLGKYEIYSVEMYLHLFIWSARILNILPKLTFPAPLKCFFFLDEDCL